MSFSRCSAQSIKSASLAMQAHHRLCRSLMANSRVSSGACLLLAGLLSRSPVSKDMPPAMCLKIVRISLRIGHEEVDIAADSGRRRRFGVDACRVPIRARGWWCFPCMLDLHRYMVVASRIVVDHDGRGGSAVDPAVWDQGKLVKRRRLHVQVVVDRASMPVPVE